MGSAAKGGPCRGLAIAGGTLGIIAGTIGLAWPQPTLLVLALVGGLALVVLGIVLAILAVRPRTVRSAEDLQHVIAA